MSILSGSLYLNGNITSSGDISFSTSGSGIVQTLTNIIPNGTSSYGGSSNTTASVNFGLNLITTANPQNYCAKLPQPVTGKSVTVINKSGIEIKLFPSNVGGDINGITNGFTIIPSDGRSYVFNCYENPLPGGWSVVTQNSTTNVLSSGVISSSLAGWLNPNYQHYVWAFINQGLQVTGSGTAMNTHWPFYNFNQYGIIGSNQVVGNLNYSQNGAGSWILPSNPGTLTSIRIITNLKYDTNYFQIGATITGRKLFLDHANINNVTNPISAWAYVNTSTDSGYATWRDNTWLPWITQNPGNTPYDNIDVDSFISTAYFPSTSITTTSTPGTFTPGPGVSGSILSDNPGDPGTMIFNLDMTAPMLGTNDPFPSFNNLGITPFLGAFVNDSNQLIDAFWVKDFGITLENMNFNNYYPNLKIIPQYTFLS